MTATETPRVEASGAAAPTGGPARSGNAKLKRALARAAVPMLFALLCLIGVLVTQGTPAQIT
ncbi:MAG TPA: hypothetical protein VLV15_11965, partial [Dongiaceae bacterium]|nr:hypothetical protein [Dongiaceae bacterium]